MLQNGLRGGAFCRNILLVDGDVDSEDKIVIGVKNVTNVIIRRSGYMLKRLIGVRVGTGRQGLVRFSVVLIHSGGDFSVKEGTDEGLLL